MVIFNRFVSTNSLTENVYFSSCEIVVVGKKGALCTGRTDQHHFDTSLHMFVRGVDQYGKRQCIILSYNRLPDGMSEAQVIEGIHALSYNLHSHTIDNAEAKFICYPAYKESFGHQLCNILELLQMNYCMNNSKHYKPITGFLTCSLQNLIHVYDDSPIGIPQINCRYSVQNVHVFKTYGIDVPTTADRLRIHPSLSTVVSDLRHRIPKTTHVQDVCCYMKQFQSVRSMSPSIKITDEFVNMMQQQNITIVDHTFSFVDILSQLQHSRVVITEWGALSYVVLLFCSHDATVILFKADQFKGRRGHYTNKYNIISTNSTNPCAIEKVNAILQKHNKR